MSEKLSALASSAFRFVVILGVVNFFSDMTYEGGAAINGQYLASFGATAAAVSIIAGFGEFLGYSLRSLAGYLADRTGRYWLITFFGYAVNLLAVPAMALAWNWQSAAAFILAERVGRAFRKPTVEAMLSYSTGKHGRGWVYSFNTAMDETGAALGPLVIAFAFFLRADYRAAFAIMIIPSVLALISLAYARVTFPVPSKLEEGGPATATRNEFPVAYWLYMIAGSLFAMGIMSFELVAYHLSESDVVSEAWLPVFLSMATISAIAASLFLGQLYDRIGIAAVAVAVVVSACFSPLVFFGGFWISLVGLLLWGVGYATQDTLLKVLIAGILPKGRRNLAFGLFYLGYGGGWFIGSVATGLIYEHSRLALVSFAIAAQVLSLPFFLLGARSARKTEPQGQAGAI
jgi:MFS family permease